MPVVKVYSFPVVFSADAHGEFAVLALRVVGEQGCNVIERCQLERSVDRFQNRIVLGVSV